MLISLALSLPVLVLQTRQPSCMREKLMRVAFERAKPQPLKTCHMSVGRHYSFMQLGNDKVMRSSNTPLHYYVTVRRSDVLNQSFSR